MGDKPDHGFSSTNEAKTCPFNKEQVNHLLRMLKSHSSSGFHVGNNSNTFSSCTKFSLWFINPRASNQMTGFYPFSTYSPCFKNEKKKLELLMELFHLLQGKVW